VIGWEVRLKNDLNRVELDNEPLYYCYTTRLDIDLIGEIENTWVIGASLLVMVSWAWDWPTWVVWSLREEMEVGRTDGRTDGADRRPMGAGNRYRPTHVLRQNQSCCDWWSNQRELNTSMSPVLFLLSIPYNFLLLLSSPTKLTKLPVKAVKLLSVCGSTE